MGIDSSANLPDLNDMTDRGKNPLKPWTASKTIGTIKMIRDFNITNEESFVSKFQELSKVPLEKLTDQVYEHQIKYFGEYKYSKNVIFKYTYCCVVINSLRGNSTEKLFDKWAKKKGIKIRLPKSTLDEQYHIDRIQINRNGSTQYIISIKPNSFSHNFMQYRDVFAGLQHIANKYNIPWRIFYLDETNFKEISFNKLTSQQQQNILSWSLEYRS